MTSRVLPPEEWGKLQATGMATLARSLHMLQDSVVVVEDGDRIVGAWAFKIVPHVEGLWIAEDKRGTAAVARRLWPAMTEHAKSRGALVVVTGADQPNVRALLERQKAVEMPPQFYLALTGGT